MAHDGVLHMCTDANGDERKSRLQSLFQQAFLPVQFHRLQASVSNTVQAAFFFSNSHFDDEFTILTESPHAWFRVRSVDTAIERGA